MAALTLCVLVCSMGLANLLIGALIHFAKPVWSRGEVVLSVGVFYAGQVHHQAWVNPGLLTGETQPAVVCTGPSRYPYKYSRGGGGCKRDLFPYPTLGLSPVKARSGPSPMPLPADSATPPPACPAGLVTLGWVAPTKQRRGARHLCCRREFSELRLNETPQCETKLARLREQARFYLHNPR